jgi:hypothetical protein
MEGMISANDTLRPPMAFEVQCGINVARSDKFMSLLADANFELLWMGIESPSRDSLVSIRKLQNVPRNLIDDCRRIGSYGIGIAAYMIVGIDEDDEEIFDRHVQFWKDASILVPIVNILTAIPHTKLWLRLAREGRLILTPGAQQGLFDITSNVVPKRMTRKQLVEGYRYLLHRSADWDFFAERLVGWIDRVTRIPNCPAHLPGDVMIRAHREALQGGDTARKYFDDLVAHVQREKPSLLRRVFSYIGNHDGRAHTLNRYHIPQLSEMIRKRAFDGCPRMTKWSIPIPEGFRSAFHQILPQIYARLSANLQDETRLPEALTKVFADFLVRFAHEFGELHESHVRHLEELADKVCGEFNGIPAGQFIPRAAGGEPPRGRALNHLADSLLKAIAEDLIRQDPSLHRPERQPVHLG